MQWFITNFFQHITYLNRFREDRKLDIVDVVQGPMAPFGIYSKKRKSLADVKPGDRITLANDPANLAHGLALLADQKLLTLKPGADPIRVTEFLRPAKPATPTTNQPQTTRAPTSIESRFRFARSS